MNLYREITAGDGLRYGCHLPQVIHHIVEGAGQFPNFIAGSDFHFLVEVAGIGDLARNNNELGQRLGNRLRRLPCDHATHAQHQQEAQDRHQ